MRAPAAEGHRGMMKPKILVVDDEPMIADTLGIIFQKRGFDCRISYTGLDAIACTKEFQPELLLCDMTMPGMSGLELQSRLRAEGRLPRAFIDRRLRQSALGAKMGAPLPSSQ